MHGWNHGIWTDNLPITSTAFKLADPNSPGNFHPIICALCTLYCVHKNFHLSSIKLILCTAHHVNVVAEPVPSPQMANEVAAAETPVPPGCAGTDRTHLQVQEGTLSGYVACGRKGGGGQFLGLTTRECSRACVSRQCRTRAISWKPCRGQYGQEYSASGLKHIIDRVMVSNATIPILFIQYHNATAAIWKSLSGQIIQWPKNMIWMSQQKILLEP